MLPDDLATPIGAVAPVAVIGSIIVKSTAILLLGVVCAMTARAASAAARHLIWTLTLAGAMVVPAAAAVVPAWHVPALRWLAAAWPFQLQTDAARATAAASTDAVLAPPMPAASRASTPTRAAVRHERGERESVVPVRAMTAASTPVAVVAADAAVEAEVAMAAVGGGGAASTPGLQVTADAVAAATPAANWARLAQWAVVVWISGVVVTLALTIMGLLRLAAIGRRARPMLGGRWALLAPTAMRELDVRRRVRFLELDHAMPMTWGVLRPVVLLPSGDFESTIAQRLDVLRHELAHVRRYDCLTQLVGQLACAVYWFNPLVWLAARQLRVERERACDDEVLRAGSKASDYAEYLLRVARTMQMPGVAAFGGLAMARPSQLAGRLRAVLDDARHRDRLSATIAARAVLAALAVVTGVASVAPAPMDAKAARPTIASAPARPVVTTTSTNGRGITPVVAGAPEVDVALPSIAEPALADISLSSAVVLRAPLPSVAPAAALAAQPAAPCDRTTRNGKGSSHTSLTGSDNGAKRWRVLWSEGDCSYEIEARGEVTYNRDVTDVESITAGGSFTIEQHIGDDTRRLAIRPRADGTLERSYSVNGSRQEYDAGARAWLAEALVALDRQTAFAVDQRVPAILERGGVNAVLQEITLLGSDYARRRYYTKLLATRQLDRAQVRRVVEQAGSEMSSDYELAELLVALSKVDAFSDDSHTAFVSASKRIDSDYERRRALNALLARDRLAPATVQALLDASSTIKSDYELAELLISVSKRYAMNDETRPVYLKAVGSIQSDYEHRRVLAAIANGGGLTPGVTRALLQDAGRIGSDYELAEFLIQMGKKDVLDATTSDAYFAAADKIDSDYEHRRALTPLLTRDLLTKDLAKAILASAAKIDSDYECASLLIEIAKAITIDDELRPAYDRAAESIQGEYEYGRAMSAVRRRVTR